MRAVAGQTHLHRRGGTYYFRRRVPKALRYAFPFDAWVESLHTTDFEEAKRLVRVRSVEIDTRIRAAEAQAVGVTFPPLRPDEAAGLAAAWLRERLNEDEEARLAGGSSWYRNQEVVLLEKAATAKCQLAKGLWRCVGKDADEALAKVGRFYAKEDPSRRLMGGELLKAQVAYYEAVEARQRGKLVEAPAVPRMPLSAPSGPLSGHTVGDLITAYTADKRKTHGEAWVTKRYGHIFRALGEILAEDKPLASLTRADGRAVRDFLSTIPQHAGKRYPKLSLREAAAAAERDGSPTLAPKSVASYLQNLNAMMNWAVAEDWLARNPLSGLVGKAEARTERQTYTPKELRSLFTSLLPYREALPWRFWIPALGLYTGARLNELAQLRVEDVVEVASVVCIRISPYTAEGRQSDDKRVKTKGSKRTVPLHPELIAAGFVEWARERGKPQERVFHELPKGPNGGYSHEASRWYAKHLKAAGLHRPGLVFHSLRHTFRDAARDGGVTKEVAEALGGWSNSAVSERYGDRGRVRLLSDAVAKLDFGGFSLAEVASAPPA